MKAKVHFYDHESGKLYFHLEKPSIADRPDKAVPFEFDGPAEPKHIADYSGQYDLYLKSKEEKPVKVEVKEEAPKKLGTLRKLLDKHE